jgi:hypothetical protein
VDNDASEGIISSDAFELFVGVDSRISLTGEEVDVFQVIVDIGDISIIDQLDW